MYVQYKKWCEYVNSVNFCPRKFERAIAMYYGKQKRKV